ncbi:EF-hand domain-containing protein [Tabrizicola sp.]|uniref:EF-hand domain-containing protein n=1 Tax=Tabrizicola sp. TaxID=2005166 RepID=UPI003F40EACC
MRNLLLSLALPPLMLLAPMASAQDNQIIGMIFDRLDSDGSGDVSQAEITAAKERQFAKADTDGNGLVTEAELAAVQDRMARLARLGSDGLAERARRLDQDGDKAVSLAEYTATSPILTLIDADGNGAISRAELDRARAAFPQQP